MAPTKKLSGRYVREKLAISRRSMRYSRSGKAGIVPKLRCRDAGVDLSLQLVDPSIVSIFYPRVKKNPSSSTCELKWYRQWLAEQICQLPDCVLHLITDRGAPDLSRDSKFYRIFMEVNSFARQADSPSIDDVAEKLLEDSLITSDQQHRNAWRLLIFALLGWQSMLYLPSFNTCSLAELAIDQCVEQPNSRLVFDTFKLSVDLADRPMAILLKGYGNLLPARSQDVTMVASETSRVASSWLPMNPLEMNAHFLHSLLRIEIQWVDTLALHLDYDKSTRTLSLFCYPSLCVAMLQSEGALYSFASTEVNASDPRANFDDITDILHEVLLSYRLLFGQSSSSRKFFLNSCSRTPMLDHNPDPFLSALCSRQRFFHPNVSPDRSVYFAHRDFPVLAERIELLGKELKGTKPKSWKDLLLDRRDTTQYWGFWLVAIFGTASLLLSLIQVILQGMSLHP